MAGETDFDACEHIKPEPDRPTGLWVATSSARLPILEEPVSKKDSVVATD